MPAGKEGRARRRSVDKSLGKCVVVENYTPESPEDVKYVHLQKGDIVDIFFKGAGFFEGFWKGEVRRGDTE